MSSYYHSTQSYQIEDAHRILKQADQDVINHLNALDIKVNNMDVRLNGVAGHGDALIPHLDYHKEVRDEVNENGLINYNHNSDIVFKCMINGEHKGLSLSSLIKTIELYEEKIHDLEERLSAVEFYGKEEAA